MLARAPWSVDIPMRFKLDENLGRRGALRPGPPLQGRAYASAQTLGAGRERQFDLNLNSEDLKIKKQRFGRTNSPRSRLVERFDRVVTLTAPSLTALFGRITHDYSVF